MDTMIVIDGFEYIPVQEVALRKGVTEGTVKSAVSRGSLPSIRDEMLKRRLIRIVDADAWVLGTQGGKRAGSGRKKKDPAANDGATEEEQKHEDK